MTSNIVPSNQSGSPFDAIRRYDENGIKFWKARELQKLLGYIKWQKFEDAIEIGIENLESAIGDTTGHLTRRGKVSTASDPVPLQDYKLSRLACYHIALACDSRGKPEVKLAKHYFAVKTREAELAPKSPAEMLVVYAQMFLEQELERFKNGHGYWFSIAGWCAKLGVKKTSQRDERIGSSSVSIVSNARNHPRTGHRSSMGFCRLLP